MQNQQDNHDSVDAVHQRLRLRPVLYVSVQYRVHLLQVLLLDFVNPECSCDSRIEWVKQLVKEWEK